MLNEASLGAPADEGRPAIPSRRPVKRLAVAALRRQFETTQPDVLLSPSGYVSHLEHNLIAGAERRQFVPDFEQGDGRELDGKFLAVHSSAALAVNTFAPFKGCSDQLSLAGITGFDTIAFEFRCATGLRGGRPAHLDLLAQGQSDIVAVESKCTEYLEPKVPTFSPAYAEQILDERRASPWFRAMEAILAAKESFAFLDAAQLIKHAFGLARCFPSPVTLLYLYWEPLDGDQHACVLQHREEIRRFARLVAGGNPTFQAQTYLDLWGEWALAGRLRNHVANLRARYEVSVGDGRLDRADRS